MALGESRGGGRGREGSLFQPILGSYIVRNDIDKTKVGLLVKYRMLDGSSSIKILKSLSFARHCSWARLRGFNKR